uniref:Glycoside hydrolase family 5 domain-containing protein n=1 Tax=Panagrolaimus davidi TaxID=227884 RepID=A0A914QSY0_9BILA
MAENSPHVLFEIWNEPKCSWPIVKSYAENVIDLIRTNSPNNIIIVGTPTYSQRVDTASLDPIAKSNIAYTLHYYAATHKGTQRNQTLTAINNGLPVFITEYGTVDALGAGEVDVNSSIAWWNLADENKISYVNWGVFPSDATPPGSAAFITGTTNLTIKDSTNWTPSGKFVNQKYFSTVQYSNNFGCTA